MNQPHSPMPEKPDALTGLAAAAGILVDWTDAYGHPQRISSDTLRRVLDALDLPADTPQQAADSLARLNADDGDGDAALRVGDAGRSLPLPCAPGSFRLLDDAQNVVMSGRLEAGERGGSLLPPVEHPGYYRLESGNRSEALAVAPRPRPRPAGGDGGHSGAWGVVAQLYSLRRAVAPALGGCGDFSALAELVEACAREGADAVAVSPLHAMFSANPAHYSPYSPSSRLFLNAWYADPDEVMGPGATAQALAELGMAGRARQLEAAPHIDWPEVAGLRLAVMRKLYQAFERRGEPRLREAFAAYRRQAGEALESHARFEALHARFLAGGDAGRGWRQWPQAMRRPDGAAVRAFAAEHAGEVGFHAFLQWRARLGLDRVCRAARDAGMGTGLIADLAVGTDPAGSHAWSRQDDIVAGLSPGAPPDIYNARGQAWNLTAFSPVALRRNGYAAFIEMLRAVLAGAGGIRVDHALGLARMWLVPEGWPPTEGAYLTYPLDDMLRLVALEAFRHEAIAVGENLGTVPPGFNDRIAQAGMLGMSVLWFEREEPAAEAPPDATAPFRPPSAWNPATVAMTTTHDLPTCAGWWSARDLRWRGELGLLGEDTPARAEERRAAEREALWQAMRQAGWAEGPAPPADEPPVDRMLGFVAASACPLALLPLEDVLAMQEQPNLPGTRDEHPNWVQRLAVPAAALYDDAPVQERIDAVRRARAQGAT